MRLSLSWYLKRSMKRKQMWEQLKQNAKQINHGTLITSCEHVKEVRFNLPIFFGCLGGMYVKLRLESSLTVVSDPNRFANFELVNESKMFLRSVRNSFTQLHLPSCFHVEIVIVIVIIKVQHDGDDEEEC